MANLPFISDLRLRDLGDVRLDGEDLESAQASFASAASWAIQTGAIPIGLGGGHEIAYASYAGLRQAKPDDKIGLLYFDAHFDLREDSWRTSGTSVREILIADSNVQALAIGISPSSNTLKLFQLADDLKVKFILDTELQDSRPWPSSFISQASSNVSCLDIIGWIDEVDSLYVSFDLDVLPAHEAPGVSAPAGWGVPYGLLRPILQSVMKSRKVWMLDVAELNPSYDLDSRTARLASRIIWDSVTWLN